MSKKISIIAGTPELQAGLSYEWENQGQPSGDEKVAQPVLEIQGNGADWAKVTEGSVAIRGSSARTAVKVSGSKGWKIVGSETVEA